MTLSDPLLSVFTLIYNIKYTTSFIFIFIAITTTFQTVQQLEAINKKQTVDDSDDEIIQVCC